MPPKRSGPAGVPVIVKRGRALIVARIVTLLLLGVALYLGLSAESLRKPPFPDQWNAQEDLISNLVARNVEERINDATADLTFLNALVSPAVSASKVDDLIPWTALPILNRDFITELSKFDQNGNPVFRVGRDGVVLKDFGPSALDARALAWASNPKNRGGILVKPVRPASAHNADNTVVMTVIVPTYSASRDSIQFRGYLKGTVNLTLLLQNTFESLGADISGNLWITGPSGESPNHREPSSLDEDAFLIHSRKAPRLPEGEGFPPPFDGRPRHAPDPKGRLIAGTPLRINAPSGEFTWKVGVLAHGIRGANDPDADNRSLSAWIIIAVLLFANAAALVYEKGLLRLIKREAADSHAEAGNLSLLAYADDLIFTTDAYGTVRNENAVMPRLLGFDENEMPELHLRHFLPEDEARAQLLLIRGVLGNGKPESSEATITTMKRECRFDLRYTPVPVGTEGERKYVLCVGRDITSRAKREKQLIEMEKLASLGTLAAGLAHEINNPLGIILGFCELLLEKTEPGTQEFKDLETIEKQGLNCKAILERLILFANMREDLESCCNVNSVVASALSACECDLKKNETRIVTSFGKNIPLVRGAHAELRHAILNLIVNSIQAIKNHGTLKITTCLTLNAGAAQIIISDTGKGIRREHLRKIFDPFFTTKEVGQGLGLSVSYRIISNYGGTITCDSCTEEETPGSSGTQFSILLPVMESVSSHCTTANRAIQSAWFRACP